MQFSFGLQCQWSTGCTKAEIYRVNYFSTDKAAVTHLCNTGLVFLYKGNRQSCFIFVQCWLLSSSDASFLNINLTEHYLKSAFIIMLSSFPSVTNTKQTMNNVTSMSLSYKSAIYSLLQWIYDVLGNLFLYEYVSPSFVLLKQHTCLCTFKPYKRISNIQLPPSNTILDLITSTFLQQAVSVHMRG